MPGALDVGAEPHERFPLIWSYAVRRRGAERIEFVLKPSLLLQALVPAPLEFARDQPVVGIDGVILPSSVRSLETRLLERQLDLPALLGVLASTFLKSRQSRFDAQRLNALDDFGGDRGIDAKTAEGDAALRPVVEEGALAVIARDVALRSAVSDMQLAPAMAAAEQAGEQGFPSPHGAPARPALAVGVVADQALIPLEGIPADITLMVVADQNVPLRPLDPNTARDAFSAILDSRLADRPAVRIGAGVNRVGEDVMDRIVDRRLPLQAPAFRAVADGGEQDPLLPKPEMDLPHALQFFELPKDERKRFAHA